jgi:hypothetical protein
MSTNFNNSIVKMINDKYKHVHNFYLYNNHTEQSKRDRILHIINNKTDINKMIEQIKYNLFLKNHTYKVTCISFKWLVDEQNNSFYVIFGFSTFYNNTGKEQINKTHIRNTSIKRLETKPFIKHVFIDTHVKITYAIIYKWLKLNIKKYRYSI